MIEIETPIELSAFPNLAERYRMGLVHPESHVDPTSEHIKDFWKEFYTDEPTRVVPGVIGVMRDFRPIERPHTLVSVDLCDVVRTTCDTFMSLEGLTSEAAGENYGYGIPFDIHKKPDIVTNIIRGLMAHDDVGPVEGIDRIRDILQNMRNNGAFIVGNTSTLTGCEPSTVRFMGRHLPDCFDGILFPRNHDGKGRVSKGLAKSIVYKELQALEDVTTIRNTQHIDDAPHHIRSAREAAAKLKVTSHYDVTPKYAWNEKHEDLNITDTPLEAFEQSAEVFNGWKNNGRIFR